MLLFEKLVHVTRYNFDNTVQRENKMKDMKIKENQVETLCSTKFLKMYDLQYREGKHYFDATRRECSELVALKSGEEFRSMLPDAVTVAVVVKVNNEEPKLLLSYEYRYPVSQYLLSPVAGLIDEEDKTEENPLISAAVREIKEECGLTVKPYDKIYVINPCAFSSPGMTDESNAFLCAEISVDNLDELSHDGAVGGEMFDGFEIIGREEAASLFGAGRDKNGNYFSLATWAVLAYFISKDF